jgi:exosortase/archaeosortase family protein
MKTPDLVFEKLPWLSKFKPILLFFAKVFLLYLAFLFVKLIHRMLIAPEMNSAISSYLRNLDVYVIGSNAITYPSQWILQIFGYTTLIEGRIISIPGFRGIIIHAPCLGYSVFSVFIALIIAFPVQASRWVKAIFIFSGIIMIHLLNIFRVSALVVLNKYSIPITYHHELFNLIIYGFVFTLFYWWINQYSREVKI